MKKNCYHHCYVCPSLSQVPPLSSCPSRVAAVWLPCQPPHHTLSPPTLTLLPSAPTHSLSHRSQTSWHQWYPQALNSWGFSWLWDALWVAHDQSFHQGKTSSLLSRPGPHKWSPNTINPSIGLLSVSQWPVCEKTSRPWSSISRYVVLTLCHKEGCPYSWVSSEMAPGHSPAPLPILSLTDRLRYQNVLTSLGLRAKRGFSVYG